jgi:PAS domain S-box-containing protein
MWKSFSKILKRLLGPDEMKPMRLLTWAMLMNFILLPVVASIVWSMYHSFSSMGTDEFRLQKLVGDITHLNEVRTMSARMLATTGDSRWKERYADTEPLLDEAITEIALLSREEYERNYAAQTKLAYTKLIEMESLALSLIRAGRGKEASELLFSPEYDRQQALYSFGLGALASAVEQHLNNEIGGFWKRLWQVGLLGIISLLILPIAWAGVWLVVKGHFRKRKQAEEALQKEKERLSVTLRSIGEGVITTNAVGNAVMINRMAEVLTGWTQQEAAGKAVDEVFHTIDQKTGQRIRFPVVAVRKWPWVNKSSAQVILVAKDGSKKIIAQTSAPICDPASNFVGVVMVFRDLTEQQAMQAELAKAEKLESVGLLAGGIAHDFNNILTVILGNISLAKNDVPPESESFERLEAAEKASMKATQLTHQLLTFSKGGLPVKNIASIKELLAEWSTFALRGSNVRCEFDIEENLWASEIDSGQIGRVISNLVINADQAMPNGGAIYIRARNHIAVPNGTHSLRPGKYVRITVQDQGEGIPAEHLNRIFDPYFSTKATGSGLGLTTAYSVIKRHDGHVSVESKVGEGTIFSVFLPACLAGEPKTTSVNAPRSNGTGRILVMDDDEAVRELAAEMLNVMGYEVCTAAEGSEAVSLYERCKNGGRSFDAVIMDLTVPGGMGGAEAIRILRRLDPEIRAIVSSGYANGPIMGNYRQYGFSGVLRKPYSAENMNEVLCQVINEKRGRSVAA